MLDGFWPEISPQHTLVQPKGRTQESRDIPSQEKKGITLLLLIDAGRV